MVAASTDARPWTLLAVDGDAYALAALRRVVRPTGWRLLTAGRAAEARALLATDPIDAVLSDLRLPDGAGWELFERVGRGWPDAARVLVTARPDPALLIEAINHGRLHGCIAKPWNDDELVSTLRRIVQRRRFEAARHALARLALERDDASPHGALDDAAVVRPPTPPDDPGARGTLCLRTSDLRRGQTLARDFRSPAGALLLSAGHRLDDALIERIRDFERQHRLSLTLAVLPPAPEAPEAAA